MYTIKPNPNSQYKQVKPRAQQKALSRNGTRFVSVAYKGKTYNGVIVNISRKHNNATMRLAQDNQYRVFRLSEVDRINAQGLIMEY